MAYYRIDIVERNEIVTVCTTEDRAEAERVYDVWKETHSSVVMCRNEKGKQG